jgi:hypothetical protein
MFDDPASVVGEMLQILGRSTIRGYLRRQFFKDHLTRYSKSRRKAPLLAANGFLKQLGCVGLRADAHPRNPICGRTRGG